VAKIKKNVKTFFYIYDSNLGPISHRLATIHSWRTTDGRQPWQQLDRYLSTVG